MAAKRKKPRGFGKFDSLARKLVQVDKGAVDKRIERDKAKRIQRRKKTVSRSQRGQSVALIVASSKSVPNADIHLRHADLHDHLHDGTPLSRPVDL